MKLCSVTSSPRAPVMQCSFYRQGHIGCMCFGVCSVKCNLLLQWLHVLQALEEHRSLIDNRSSFKNYRDAFAAAKPPCIPYM